MKNRMQKPERTVNPRALFSSLLLATLLIVFAGCDSSDNDPQPGMLEISFAHMANGQQLVLNQSTHTSAAGHEFTVSLLEYIVTEIAVVSEDGSVVDLEPAHYSNDEMQDTKQLLPVEIPGGSYTALRFTFGIKGEDNVFGNLERTTDMDNMLWPMMMPMGDGTTERYHYMRLEGRYGTDGVFRIHLGPTSGGDYSFTVELPVTLDIDGNTWDVGVAMNLDEWLANPNVWDFDDYGMIMGNPDAQALMKANGASVFAIDHATSG